MLISVPNFLFLVRKITLPLDLTEDSMAWTALNSSCLSLKDVAANKSTPSTPMTRLKHLWNLDIPPSKAFLVWRLCHNKVPTDLSLSPRGCCVISMNNLCRVQQEDTYHLFFHCTYSRNLWNWFFSLLGIGHFSSILTSFCCVTGLGALNVGVSFKHILSLSWIQYGTLKTKPNSWTIWCIENILSTWSWLRFVSLET